MFSGYLQCIEESCRRRQDAKGIRYRCDFCGGLLDVNYEFDSVDPECLRRTWEQRRLSNELNDRSGVWRFRELLPFLGSCAEVISLCEGSTPLVEAKGAGEWAGCVHLTIKHQGKNPTGSFKDLGMTACITQAASLDVCVVACASTGNTSSSMAAYAARAGMKALLFVPAGGISAAKLAQAIDFGALVVEVGDRFDQAFQLLNAVAAEMGLYVVNSINPFRIEGQKTIVAELMEQRGWRPPDWIVLPGGNLGNVSAIGKGLHELKTLGLIEELPRLAVIQAAGANPFYQMLASGARELVPMENPRTEATAIRIGRPANWKKARRALEWTAGLCESVTDEEILEAKNVLAQDGLGCEPASAAAVAGVRKLCQAGKVGQDAEVVAILTGDQLKDADYILKRRAQSGRSSHILQVEPAPEALRKALESWAPALVPAKPST